MGKNQRSAWPEVWLNVNLTWSFIWGVHLARGQPDWGINTLGHKMSLGGKYVEPKVNLSAVVTHLATRCHWQGSFWPKSTWPKDLTKLSTQPKASPIGVHLTKCKKEIWNFENTLHFRSCFTDVFSTKEQRVRTWSSMELASESEGVSWFMVLEWWHGANKGDMSIILYCHWGFL